MPGGWGECGARGRGLISCAPGRLGHHACRHYDRRVRCFTGLGQARRVMPVQTASQEAWPELRLRRRKSLWREPWWNAGRRARPQAEGGASRLSVARPARRLRAGVSTYASAGVPLPLFLTSSLRGAKRRSNPERYRAALDCFASSRNDDPSLFDIAVCRTRAPSRRENERTCPPPRKRGRGTTRSLRSKRRVVEGAFEMELRCRRRTIGESDAPPTALLAQAQPTLRVGVLYFTYGGRRPPMPPSPLSRGRDD